MAKRKLAVVENTNEETELKEKLEQIRHREELNRAAAKFVELCGRGEGPFEYAFAIKDKATKRKATIRGTVDLSIVHFREDQDRLQIFIPVTEIQNVQMYNPERSRVEE